MDPLTAISLAGNIIQFGDFFVKTLSKGYELYQSADGALKENQELEVVVKHLHGLSKRLAASTITRHGAYATRPESEDEKELRAMTISCARLAEELMRALESLKLREPHKKWKSAGQALRTIWTQGRIDELVQRLDRYRQAVATQLMALGNSNQIALTSAVDRIEKQVGHVQSTLEIEHRQIQLDIMTTVKQLSSAHDKLEDREKLLDMLIDMKAHEDRIRNEQAFLDTLYFSQLPERSERIVEAHDKTFDWIYLSPEEKETPRPWGDFRSWLEYSHGIYWISGKPGSGKSTLMKYLYRNPRTRAYLQQWSGSSKLVCASFYFWLAGTTLQKSILGLLRSLFYEMLINCRDLIEVLFPWRLRKSRNIAVDSNPWTMSEFEHALKTLRHQPYDKFKFCFFIDGLDEYDGDHAALIRFLEGLADLPNFKLCLSSRPWPVFQDAWEEFPMLRVQDLTHDDIRAYISDNLENHPSYFRMLRLEHDKASRLINELTDRASGVFLWVFLVVRSLREGMSNGDRIGDLQRRVDSVPSDLEEFFHQILDTVSAFYFAEAAKFFRLALESEFTLPLITYSLLDEDYLKDWVSPLIKPSSEVLTIRCAETERRVNSRCKGLLDVHTSRCGRLLSDLQTEAGEFRCYKVGFLHRTVRDFLSVSNMGARFVAKDDDTFCAPSILAQSIVGQMRHMQHQEWSFEDDSEIFDLISTMPDMAMPAIKSLDRLAYTMEKQIFEDFILLLHDYQAKATHAHDFEFGFSDYLTPLNTDENFLSTAASYGLTTYIKYRLKGEPELATRPMQRTGMPLLHDALDPRSITSRPPRPCPQMVRTLLEKGADPNIRSRAYQSNPTSTESATTNLNMDSEIERLLQEYGDVN